MQKKFGFYWKIEEHVENILTKKFATVQKR